MSEAIVDRPPYQEGLILFDQLPERPDLLRAIAARPAAKTRSKWRHTGRRFFEKCVADQSPGGLAETVLTGLLMGLSVRLLAWRLGISPNTLAQARKLFTASGELEPVRLRVDRLLDEVTEESLEYWRDGLRAGAISPGQIPIPALAAYDKRAQRDAGLVPGTERTQAAVTVEQVLAERVGALLSLADDTQSEGAISHVVVAEACIAKTAGPATAPTTGIKAQHRDEGVPAVPGAEPSAASARKPPAGAGGVSASPSLAPDRWVEPENFNA